MSFILDALKKSENERQKQGGPALFEVKVAPPPRRFPTWAIVVGVLLGVNLIVLLAVLVMRDKQDPAVQATQAQIAANAAANAAATATANAAAQAAPPAGALPAPGTGPGPGPTAAPNATYPNSPPGTGAVIGADGLPVAGNAPAVVPYGPAAAPTAVAGDPGALASAPATRFNPPLVEEDPGADPELPARGAPFNPSDYAPAGPPSPNSAPLPPPSGYPTTASGGPAAPPGRGSATRGSGVPSRDDLVAGGMGDLPPANLSLHVYDKNPAARFVFVNGQRAREGETLQNGLRVDEITADGAVLSFRGSRFLVPIQ